ncbi:hypothetical protein A2715_05225 [Candidatus Woesebacteria bacterium RIFCSPHIGHO2_01_FULL_39_32]|uniref:Uncharacterized protein n=1 Tax=Candidatus Woesebacteria bacterium RIFCSPLOWO2_01_FULL_39_25 TaxID=1802521 RepID=A0A1F8BLJ3_9BACT|nr:MAG: hypothetical protein A2715_05225 [Candidatus Woesebacteria bacterium RIFCSPHIGHO2_01_FULL_39_32]OGM38525.1 MAG: hypothetical protein A3F01_04185 [Candidatus Woesebacteria bacterium RIFCSPHIGHO2_12_FULL_38_11]OGM64951.1 MAG: hypothetical protein A2893_04835 [Candidatus Woesebacteria bacterium RIFCSPLOWO2_01_FULL_39_25]
MTEDRRSAADELFLVFRRKLTLSNRETDKREAIKDLLSSLGWLGKETQEKDQRVEDFEYINRRLNRLMQQSSNLPPQYRDVNLLAQNLNGRQIPTLKDARKQFYTSERIANIVFSTIEKATREYPEWARVDPGHPSIGTPASGALIEGFGAFLGQLENDNNPDITAQVNRAYVKAFEEVLITEKPSSPLLKDVIGWMKTEKEDFPKAIELKIDTFHQ